MVHEEHQDNLISVIGSLIDADDIGDAVAVLTNRHPADQADLIEELDEEVRRRIVDVLAPEEVAGFLEYLDEDLRYDLLSILAPEVLAPILDRVDDDIAADILQELEDEQVKKVLPLLRGREIVEELLEYPEDSVGARMSPDYVALHESWTIDESIGYLRQLRPDTDTPFYVYAVDDDHRLAGVINLRDLITAAPEKRIEDIMHPELISVPVDFDQEQAAERVRHYNLLALPVVDAGGHLVGVLTADDVLDVQVEEATEDIFRMAGLAEEERIFRPIREAVPPRLAWLMVNLVTAFLAATTVAAFEGTIEQVAALAIFMPMIAGMGGNAGIQTITLVVRSLALGEVEMADVARVLKHEFVIGVIKGVIIGLIVGLVAWVWRDNAWLGAIVGFAMLANIVNATLIGVLVPMGLKLFRADPALASGIFVTMLSDVMGFLVFLGLATILITRLT
jgi:magnesium transporter